jgi:hypothetical protein
VERGHLVHVLLCRRRDRQPDVETSKSENSQSGLDLTSLAQTILLVAESRPEVHRKPKNWIRICKTNFLPLQILKRILRGLSMINSPDSDSFTSFSGPVVIKTADTNTVNNEGPMFDEHFSNCFLLYM